MRYLCTDMSLTIAYTSERSFRVWFNENWFGRREEPFGLFGSFIHGLSRVLIMP
jgi:hypothetical protein